MTAPGAAVPRSTVDPATLTYDAAGLLPVVVQDVATGAVLMVAWADRDAVERTLASGQGWFWSRSRRQPWKKGETSGHVLSVVEVRADCDADTLLYRVDPQGPTCHRGTRTCFDTAVGDDGSSGAAADTVAPRLELGWLWDVLEERRAAADDDSYTARLLAAGVDRVARKVGEEATETVIAALRAAEDAAHRPALVAEAGDLLYHLLVLLMSAGATPEAVAAELRRRHAIPRAPRAPKPEEAAQPPSAREDR